MADVHVHPPHTEPAAPPSDQSVTRVVAGIINDAQELMKQQFALFKHEVKEDLRKTKEATLAIGIGATVVGLGVLLLCFGLVWLLNWAAAALPLWVCFAIIGGALAIIGAILLAAGKKKLGSINPLPGESAQALKENVQWSMNPK
jgi:hypothetical protein